MFDRRGLRRLPPDIRLEVETLISDLRGENTPQLPHLGEAAAESQEGGDLSHLLRLRRFFGGSGTSESR